MYTYEHIYVLALSHGASWPFGFKAGQQINLVVDLVNWLLSRSGCRSGCNIYCTAIYNPRKRRIFGTWLLVHNGMCPTFQEKKTDGVVKNLWSQPYQRHSGTLLCIPFIDHLSRDTSGFICGLYGTSLVPVGIHGQRKERLVSAICTCVKLTIFVAPLFCIVT